jgi:hypothetical protein
MQKGTMITELNIQDMLTLLKKGRVEKGEVTITITLPEEERWQLLRVYLEVERNTSRRVN